jgi:hypothetical protein
LQRTQIEREARAKLLETGRSGVVEDKPVTAEKDPIALIMEGNDLSRS